MDSTRQPPSGRLDDAVAVATDALSKAWVSADQANRVAATLHRFHSFCERGFGVIELFRVTPAIAEAFITAPGAAGAPSIREQHSRRGGLRLLFRSARAAGLDVGDPTLDIALPMRSLNRARPLADDEIALCRASTAWSLVDSRHAACWALVEATCRTGELPYIRREDVDLEARRVWLHGGRRTSPRWGLLSEWGVGQLDRRLDASSSSLLYGGDQPREGGRVSSSLAILEVLRRAGLATEPDVRPSSITAWAGRQVLAATGRIDVVAQRLGLRSLDRAASYIGWDWLTEPEP